MLYTFIVHAGIGDMSWTHSKLRNLPGVQEGTAKIRYLVSQQRPPRGLPFTEILPECVPGAYVPKNWRQIRKESIDVLGTHIPDCCTVDINRPMEIGVRLEECFPHLPTTYHYPFKLNQTHELLAKHLIEGSGFDPGQPIIGVHPSSFRMMRNWDTWSPVDWVRFCERICGEFKARPAIIGADFDSDMCNELNRMTTGQDLNPIPLIGQNIGTVVAAMKYMSLIVGLESGIEVLGNVLKIPVCEIYPKKHELLRFSWNAPGVPYVAPMWGMDFDEIYSEAAQLMES